MSDNAEVHGKREPPHSSNLHRNPRPSRTIPQVRRGYPGANTLRVQNSRRFLHVEMGRRRGQPSVPLLWGTPGTQGPRQVRPSHTQQQEGGATIKLWRDHNGPRNGLHATVHRQQRAPHRHHVHGQSPERMDPTKAHTAKLQGSRNSGCYQPPRRLTGLGPGTVHHRDHWSQTASVHRSPSPHQHPQRTSGHLRPHQGRHAANNARTAPPGHGPARIPRTSPSQGRPAETSTSLGPRG